MHDHPFMPRRRDVERRFDRAAASFDDADFVHRASGDGLLERLVPVLIDAQRVLELGAATGRFSRQLARRFRKARILSLDRSRPMLRAARRQRSRFSRIREVAADAESLPLPAGSVDAVFANQLLPWIGEPARLFGEVARVLRKDGLFAFATLGPDSLRELRAAFAADDASHVHAFTDMHVIGDALLAAGLRDPVLDVDYLEVTYEDCHSLYRDLTACGGRNCLAGRRPSLTGRSRLRQAESRLAGGGPFGITLELVFGHAWGGQPRAAPGEFTVAVEELRGRRRASSKRP